MLAQLWNSFQEGGWAMYFIFALGFLGVGAGGRFAGRGEHELLPFLRRLAITLIACGAFGFLIGWQRALQAALQHLTRFAPPDLVPRVLHSLSNFRGPSGFEGRRNWRQWTSF